MKINTSKQDIFWGYLGTLVTLGAFFVMLPFSIAYLDENELGLWYVFQSIATLANLIDFGFSPSFARFVAYAWTGISGLEQKENSLDLSKNDKEDLTMLTVLATSKRIYSILSFAVFAILVVGGSFYVISISRVFLNVKVIVAWLIFALSISINIRYSYFNTCLRGIGAVAHLNKSSVYARSIQILVTVLLLYKGAGLFGVSIAYLLYGFTFRYLSSRFFYRQTSGQFQEAKADKKTITRTIEMIWPKAWRDGLVQLSAFLVGQATTIVGSLYYPLSVIGPFSISMQIATAIATVSGAFYNSQQPAMQSAIASNDRTTLRHSTSLTICVFIILYLLGVIGAYFIGIPLLMIIKKGTIIDSNLFLMLSLFQFINKRTAIYASIISNFNQIPYYKSFVVTSIISAFLMFFMLSLFPNFGLYSIAISLLLPQLVYNAWKWPTYAINVVGISRKEVLTLWVRKKTT